MIQSFIKTLTFSACFAGALVAVAQTIDVERSARVEEYILGVQTGYLGCWGYYEHRLVDRVTLRTELGINITLSGKEYAQGKTIVDVLFAPTITAESRWYYNLGRRMSRSKDITENSGDFMALKTGYIRGAPFLITFSSFSSITRLNAIPVLLMWGMRRNLGYRFNYELGAKGGFLALPDNGLSVVGAYNVHLRIGYRFLGNTR